MAWVKYFRRPITKAVTALHASPDGSRVVSARGKGNGSQIEVWNGANGKLLHSFRVPHQIVDFVKLRDQGRHVAYSDWRSRRPRFWSLEEGKEIDLLPEDEFSLKAGDEPPLDDSSQSARSSQATRIHQLPSDSKLLSVGDGIAVAWKDSASESELSLWQTKPVQPLASWKGIPKGHLVAASSHPVRVLFQKDASTLLVWAARTGAEALVNTFQPLSTRQEVCTAMCSKFEWLALGDEKLTLYDLSSGAVLWRRSASRLVHDHVTEMLATQDGRFLLTATMWEPVVRLWRIGDGKRLAAFPVAAKIKEMITRGTRLIVGSDLGTVYFLEMKDLEQGPALLELWPDAQGGYFGSCPLCGAPGTWAWEESGAETDCRACGRTLSC